MRKKDWGNLSGAVADLGVLLPLLLALTVFNGANLPVILLMTGLTYIAAGYFFRLPVPVQPLKVACALAIAQRLPASALIAASLETGLILLLIGGSGLADRLCRLFDRPLVRGMQLGVGLILMERGVALAFETPGLAGLKNLAAAGWRWPSQPEWALAFFSLVIPQIPVTLSNAAVGSADAARRYYRWMAKKVSARRLCFSMGLANLAMALAGGIPLCHGSSGWTAHRRLGARSFVSTCLLGAALIALSLLLWNGSLRLLAGIPGTFLGSLLVYAGLRHALLIRDVLKGGQAIPALTAGIVSYLAKNPALGLAAGLALESLRRFFFIRRRGSLPAFAAAERP